MSNNLRTDFIQAEDTLLSLLNEDPSALEGFSEVWTALANRLSHVGQEIDQETLAVAHRVSSRIEFISKQILELHEKADAYSLALQNDLNELVTKISLVDEDVSLRELKNPPGSHLPSFILPAYTWLLHNLHNPYPSKETKCRISRAAGSSLKDVENWFVNVRKRIGWNKLRMQQFSNKRSLIVDAATRFFLANSSNLLPQSGCEAEFMVIKINAETLYPREQPFGDEFPEVLVTETNASTGRASSKRLHAKRRARAALAYPSPERSPEPNFLDNTSTLKRKQSFNESSSDSERDDLRPHPKRKRIVETKPQVSSFPDYSGLPSPAASLPELSGDSDTLTGSPSVESTLALSVTSSPPSSRKRKRLAPSEETSPPPKRMCPPSQQLHIVSNSLPSVHCVPHEDQTPNSLFNPDLPAGITTVDLASLDPSLELDIFEWNASLSESSSWTAAAMGQKLPPSPQANALSLGRIMTDDDLSFQTGSISEFLHPLHSLSSHTLESFLPYSDLSSLGLYQRSDDSPFGVSISDADWLQSSFSWKDFMSQPSLPCADGLANCNWDFDAKFSIDVASAAVAQIP